MVFSGWLDANSMLHGFKAMPKRTSLRMDAGEGAKASWHNCAVTKQCGGHELDNRPKGVGHDREDTNRVGRSNSTPNHNRFTTDMRVQCVTLVTSNSVTVEMSGASTVPPCSPTSYV